MLSGESLDSYFHNVFIRVVGDVVTFDLSDNGIEEEIAPEAYLFVGGFGHAPASAASTADFRSTRWVDRLLRGRIGSWCGLPVLEPRHHSRSVPVGEQQIDPGLAIGTRAPARVDRLTSPP